MRQASVAQTPAEAIHVVESHENLILQRRRQRFRTEAGLEHDHFEQPVVFGVVVREALVRYPFAHRLLSRGVEPPAVRLLQQPVLLQDAFALPGTAQEAHQGVGAA